VVLEMSDAQLEDVPRIKWTPALAVITNLSPHHLDRHSSYGAYLNAKLNVLGTSPPAEAIIVGPVDSIAEKALAARLSDRSTHCMRVARPASPIELQLPGRHNLDNAACVLAICGYLAIDDTVARRALGQFRGLPHRLELLRTIEGVDYFNDSKSTAPAATIKAVESFDRPIAAIVGGQLKDIPLDDWAEVMMQSCRTIICTGESGSRFAETLQGAKSALTAQQRRRSPSSSSSPAPENEQILQADSLSHAVYLARAAARPGDVVLFSPGAPSFDDYPNYVSRGLHFADLVKAL